MVTRATGDTPTRGLTGGGGRLLFDANPTPMWVYDVETLAFLDVNDAALRQYGWSRGEFLQMTILDIRPYADREAVQRHAESHREPVQHSGVWRHQRRDGSIIEVDISSNSLRYGGRRARMVCARDVTEQRRADRARAQSEERFRAVFAHAPIGEATLNERGAFLQVNPKLCELACRTPAQLLGRPFTALLHPADVEAMDTRLYALVSGGDGFFHHEARLIGCEGDEPVVALISASIVPAPLNGTEHAPQIVVLVQDITRQKQTEAHLTHQALHDSLTELANRGLFIDRLEQALHRLGRRSGAVGVLFVDLDHFKSVNDKHGHSAGDEVLRETSARLRSAVRPHDTVARFGGDELTILCEDLADEAQAVEIATRAIEAMRAPMHVAGTPLQVTACIGIATTHDQGESADALIGRADAAMYQAKEAGRDRLAVFDHSVSARAEQRQRDAERLRRAIERDELEVHYQPYVDLRTERVLGVEALVRWRHPERGLLGPREFVALAEETGLVVALGAKVLHDACRDVASWPSTDGVRRLHLSVNLSAKQLTEPDIVDSVWSALAESGLEASRLSLEITETVLMEDVESSIAALLGLRMLGVRIAIDDFGTGYSSLSYLRRFPIDQVKVDQSFVAGLGVDPAADAIVAATINLSHALGLTVVAEGVETEEQLVALQALGCDAAQGYHWSPPVPAEEIRSWGAAIARVEPSPVDVGAILAERAAVLRTTSGRNIVLDVPGRLADAMADARAVKTVVDHLLGNAARFSSVDRPVVVSAASDKRWVRVSVADFGVGMTTEETDRCFEQFWRADPSSPGTGVGLYIVRSLVEAMGGHVAVRSALGRGTTFTFTLPRSALAAARGKALATAPGGVGESSIVREFMRQLGVPTRRIHIR